MCLYVPAGHIICEYSSTTDGAVIYGCKQNLLAQSPSVFHAYATYVKASAASKKKEEDAEKENTKAERIFEIAKTVADKI